ncbi:MAG: thioredoxin domain-containing protein [Caulobacteraceae bacterium]|nr:thioredoxin domain-containing protein [Caulobacteraceae bacterium]
MSARIELELAVVARLFAFVCLALFAAPLASAQTFNAQEQAEIRAIVREYLVSNPDVLSEALDALAERVTAERWQTIKSDPRDFAVGPADAAVTIVEFYDYRCTYCHHAMQWVLDIARTRRDIRIVFKELPILSDASMEAARAALAARPQGRYLQFHQGLMSHPLDRDLTSPDIDSIARRAGVDVTRMRRAMDDPQIMERCSKTARTRSTTTSPARQVSSSTANSSLASISRVWKPASAKPPANGAPHSAKRARSPMQQ